MSFIADEKETEIVAESMIQRGGGFVRALGKALQHADHHNAAQIKVAFPEYWDTYKVLAIRFNENE